MTWPISTQSNNSGPFSQPTYTYKASPPQAANVEQTNPTPVQQSYGLPINAGGELFYYQEKW